MLIFIAMCADEVVRNFNCASFPHSPSLYLPVKQVFLKCFQQNSWKCVQYVGMFLKNMIKFYFSSNMSSLFLLICKTIKYINIYFFCNIAIYIFCHFCLIDGWSVFAPQGHLI